jgi:hypothetical protein
MRRHIVSMALLYACLVCPARLHAFTVTDWSKPTVTPTNPVIGSQVEVNIEGQVRITNQSEASAGGCIEIAIYVTSNNGGKGYLKSGYATFDAAPIGQTSPLSGKMPCYMRANAGEVFGLCDEDGTCVGGAAATTWTIQWRAAKESKLSGSTTVYSGDVMYFDCSGPTECSGEPDSLYVPGYTIVPAASSRVIVLMGGLLALVGCVVLHQKDCQRCARSARVA